jgi:hypothetical protein
LTPARTPPAVLRLPVAQLTGGIAVGGIEVACDGMAGSEAESGVAQSGHEPTDDCYHSNLRTYRSLTRMRFERGLFSR